MLIESGNPSAVRIRMAFKFYVIPLNRAMAITSRGLPRGGVRWSELPSLKLTKTPLKIG